MAIQLVTEKATEATDLPHPPTGPTMVCEFCGRNADHIIHKPMTEQAAHFDLLVTEKGS